MSFRYSCHLECSRVGRAVIVSSESCPRHCVTVNTDLPPFTVINFTVKPTGAEQNTVYKVLAVIICNPLITILYVVNECAVIVVFPAVRLTVIKYRSFTGTASFPSTDNVAAVIIINPYECNNSRCLRSFFTVTYMCDYKIRSKLVITYFGDIVFANDRYALARTASKSFISAILMIWGMFRCHFTIPPWNTHS